MNCHRRWGPAFLKGPEYLSPGLWEAGNESRILLCFFLRPWLFLGNCLQLPLGVLTLQPCPYCPQSRLGRESEQLCAVQPCLGAYAPATIHNPHTVLRRQKLKIRICS